MLVRDQDLEREGEPTEQVEVRAASVEGKVVHADEVGDLARELRRLGVAAHRVPTSYFA